MRIALVVNAFPVVSETFIFSKALALQDAGLNVTVYAHSAADDRDFFRARLAGRPLPPVAYAVTARGRSAALRKMAPLVIARPGLARQLWSEARSRCGISTRALRAWMQAFPLVAGGYDIIHFEYTGLAITYWDALPLLRNVRVMASCRGAAEQITPIVQPARAEQLRALFPLLDGVHCVSEDMMRTVEQYGADRNRAFVNHPSIDPAQFRRLRPYPGRTQGPFVVLSTGRLHWKKGFEYALLAIRQLVDAGWDLRYDIIGAGVEEERLRFAVHDLGLHERVRLRGRQPSSIVREAIEEADVFLLPSLSEGLSNAVLEATAMKVPVVSTTAGGMSEAIEDGEHGLLVPSRDPAALASAIARCLGDVDLRRRLGENARARVERDFTVQRQAARFVEQYRRISGSP